MRKGAGRKKRKDTKRNAEENFERNSICHPTKEKRVSREDWLIYPILLVLDFLLIYFRRIPGRMGKVTIILAV